MALKKEDRVRLEGLEKTFSMLVTNGMNAETITTMMQPQFNEFESITGSKVKAHFGENATLEVLDLSKDFLRIRFPNDDNRVLRAKVQGVGIEVKLFKRDDFEFSNTDVVSALHALADEVSDLPMPLNSLDVCDVRKIAEGDDSEESTSDNEGDDDIAAEADQELTEKISDVEGEDVETSTYGETEAHDEDEEDFNFLNGINS